MGSEGQQLPHGRLSMNQAPAMCYALYPGELIPTMSPIL